jgi:hypothetical protein
MAKILKKIFKVVGKVAKVVLPVVGVATGIGAIAGISKGVGAIAGIGGVLAGGKKVIDKVGVGAVNLVTGTTQTERVQVREQKAITKAVSDKVDQVKRLIKAGATESEARAKVGLSQSEVDIPVEQLNTSNLITEAAPAGAGCMITTLLILSALAATAVTIIILV